MTLGVGRWLLPALLALLFCACSKREKPPETETLPITGTVTLDDKPLAGARVTFMMVDPPASFAGRTKEDGSYQLQRVAGGKSTCKGKCKVTISRMLKPDGSPVLPGEPPAISHATESLRPIYTMPDKTQLSADVPDGGGKFDFALKSK
ncbi:MAG: carboxypeptidase-like regulatory domain-containing protein [Pirellulales bacterium]